jgi:hypothetical protein
MKKKRIILFLLVIIFGASMAYRITHPYRQKKVARLTYSGSRKRVILKKDLEKGNNGVLETPEVLMNLLVKPPHHHGEVIRDPFFEAIDRKTSAVVEPPAKQAAPVLPKAKSAEEDPRVRAQRDLSRFRVFGSCEEGGITMLFLEREKDIFIVRPGDKIDGKYLIKNINGNSLELWSEEIHENIHIDLSDF